MENRAGKDKEPDAVKRQLSPRLDLALRAIALVLVLGSLIIGLSHPAAIAVLALGWILLFVDYALKHWPGKPIH